MTPIHTSATTAAGYPFSGIFVPFPFVCFTLALFTDLIYWQTSFLMWNNFSSWLLFAGLIFGGLAVVAGIIDLFRRSTRFTRPAISASLAFIIVLLLALLNSLVHAGDGWTAVVPYGLAVSAFTVVMMIITASLSIKHRTLQYRRING
jgi:uncharacterized membrane protein